MKQMFLVLSLVCVLAASCTSLREGDEPSVESTEAADGPEPTPTVVLTIEPTIETLQLAVYPPETRTGIVELDRIIDAVFAQDVEELQSLTGYMLIGCTHTMGLGGPPKCEPDEAEGTLVESIPVLGVEGYHQRRENFEGWGGLDVLGLLAVYRVSPQAYSNEVYPAGDVAIVFLDADGITDLTLQVRGDKVVRYDFGFGGPLISRIEHEADETILPLNLTPNSTSVP